MNIKYFFSTNITPNAKSEFRITALKDNLRRTKIFAHVVIFLELILIVAAIISNQLRVEESFNYFVYLFLYFLMIFTNTVFLIYMKRIGRLEEKSEKFVKLLEKTVLVYVTFMLCWGSTISLLDQELYGHLTVFMINMVVCSVLYYIESTKMIIPFLLSLFILVVGLPFFQQNQNVLLGHYINLTVFAIISFVCSRTLYNNYCHNFNNMLLLRKMHEELEELSLIDELTCLPNRRSYNNYIEKNYNHLKEETNIAVMMIDIDYFKQYNDKHGHFAGDRVLVKVAEQIGTIVEEHGDFSARIGGEEFVWLLKNKSIDQLLGLANELRKRVFDLKIPHCCSDFAYLTVSLGIAKLTVKTKNEVYRCIELADEALYYAKTSGRNCVKTSDDFLYKKQEEATVLHG